MGNLDFHNHSRMYNPHSLWAKEWQHELLQFRPHGATYIIWEYDILSQAQLGPMAQHVLLAASFLPIPGCKSTDTNWLIQVLVNLTKLKLLTCEGDHFTGHLLECSCLIVSLVQKSVARLRRLMNTTVQRFVEKRDSFENLVGHISNLLRAQ